MNKVLDSVTLARHKGGTLDKWANNRNIAIGSDHRVKAR